MRKINPWEKPFQVKYILFNEQLHIRYETYRNLEFFFQLYVPNDVIHTYFSIFNQEGSCEKILILIISQLKFPRM